MEQVLARSSREIRDSVGHPVIDCDGHMIEVMDAAHPYLREALGPALFERWRERGPLMHQVIRRRSPEERARARVPRSAWWGAPTANVRDRATAMLPELLYERMDELGLDFTVLYPTLPSFTCAEEDDELRRGLCAGLNAFYADVYGPFSDRMTVAGIVPMHTPEEAVAEIRHCHELGLKVVVLPPGVRRPLQQPAGDDVPWMFPGQSHWFDSYGLDSAYDYDPVWQACRDLGFAATFHVGMNVRPGLYWSISSYAANHLGQFASEMYELCKSLLFGGVPGRFPDVPFVFLECGVSWASQMLMDVIEHWEKRNPEGLELLDPANLDKDRLAAYFHSHGGRVAELLADPDAYVRDLPTSGDTPDQRDEFAAMGVSSIDDLVALFQRSFFFGCESDDRGMVTAFLPSNPHGAVMRPLLSSDIGHWDVADMAHVLVESHELVDEGHLTPDQWRQVVYENPYELYTRLNPRFFDGTRVAEVLEGA
jgi:predicted TIM-barrel fold metal-dependent hydrolase